MAAFDNVVLIPIAEIEQGERYRKTPEKNIDKLAASIDGIGLLHPIVVMTPNGNSRYPLVVGQRRVLACEKLGFDEIEARVAHDMDEAEQLLAELDENVCREQMTPSEAAACVKARKILLAPLAQERKTEGRKRGGHTAGKGRPKIASEKISPELNKRTAEEAAEGTGYSGKTLSKVDKMESYLAESSLPQEVKDFIQSKLDEINSAEKPKIDPAYRAVERRVKAAKQEAEAEAATEPLYYGQKKAIEDSRKMFVNSFTVLGDAFVDAENFDPDVTPEEVDIFITDLRRLVNTLAKAVKDVGA